MSIVTQDMLNKLTPENRQRLEWRVRHAEWLLAHIAGSDSDKEQFMAMFEAAIERSFYEGMIEAKGLVDQIAVSIKTPVPLNFIAEKIGDLAELNRSSASKEKSDDRPL